MADVEVRRDSLVTETTTKKTRKVKKTKRRESSDQGSEITITEVEQTTTENAYDPDQDHDEEGYVNELNLPAILVKCSVSVQPNSFPQKQKKKLHEHEHIVPFCICLVDRIFFAGIPFGKMENR